VTSKIELKEFPGLIILDTPGINDGEYDDKDLKTFLDLVKTLNSGFVLENGVAAFVQVVMVPQSGRVRK